MSSISGLGIDRRSVSMTRTREATGSYSDDGKWVAGTATTDTIKAVIQPVSGNQLKDMPEGIRTEAQWVLWSRFDIEIDDRVTHKAVIYRVLYVWPREDGAFFRAALGRETK